MPVEAGSVVGGKLRLERLLGEGAMGTVWLARNTTLDNQVAVKVLRAHRMSDTARARFEQEARGVAQIESPHVVHVFDFGTTEDGDPFLAMEYLPGATLSDCLDEKGPLALTEVVHIVRQLCKALTVAHGRGIIDRDLKPANIFIVDVDGDPFVKVLDFGIAKHEGDDLALTESNALLGTPYYMSPEQFRSPRGLDQRSDLWSVGVIAYVCLLDHLPFDGETIGSLSLEVHRGDFEPPTSLRPELPPEIDGFFARVLAVEPNERPSSARQLAWDFTEAAGLSPSSDVTTSSPRLVHAPDASSSSPGIEHASTFEASGTNDEDIGLQATSHDEASDDDPRSSDDGIAYDATSYDESTDWRESTDTLPSVIPPAPVVPKRAFPGWVVGIIVVMLAVGGVLAMSDGSSPPSTEGTTDQTAPAPQTVAVEIAPEDASVTVNGAPKTIVGGRLELEGRPGDAFLIEVRQGDAVRKETVQIATNGVPVPAVIQLATAAPAGSSAAPPAPSPAASSTPPVTPPPTVDVRRPPPSPPSIDAPPAPPPDGPKARPGWD